ncbi:MAG: 2-amino-4-hydroxy-6-hydroxymethyldihydropteridine diphosphokinase, partial [Gammaproteobacteria bacterium]|nr:2-amino-4-hydroxy-6-hydroxymethyldihydropteridine diphosphokinase [Gammaproteobacteria bacterium]
MPRVFIGIGSNIDKEKNILSSVTALRDCFGRLEISSVYQTRAVGFEGDDFHNLVVGLDARASPR